MKEEKKISSDSINEAQSINDEVQFKGYTLEELRWQRAFMLLKADLAKETLIARGEAIRKAMPFSRSSSAKGSSSVLSLSTLQKVFTSLSYLDYFRLGSAAVRGSINIYKFFKRRR